MSIFVAYGVWAASGVTLTTLLSAAFFDGSFTAVVAAVTNPPAPSCRPRRYGGQRLLTVALGLGPTARHSRHPRHLDRHRATATGEAKHPSRDQY